MYKIFLRVRALTGILHNPMPLTKMNRGLLIVVSVILTVAAEAGGCIPPPAVECEGEGTRCTISNNQGAWEDRTQCRAANAVFPKTEAELVDAVARAVRNEQKINVVSALAHSHPRLVCVGEQGLIISTVDYASTFAVDKAARTITVDAGALMRDVIEEAAKEGLALPTLTSWDGVSAAGSVSTGAHGSGLVGRGSAINEYVVGMRLVVPACPSEGYARVVALTAEQDHELRAARLSLGTLGAISQVTFALEPMFKRSVSLSLEDDRDLENRLEGFMRAHEFANIYWYPAHRKALFGRIDRVSVDVPGDGLNKASYQPTTVNNVQKSAAKYDGIEEREDADALCEETASGMNSRVAKGGGFLNDGIKFTGYPVVGFNNRMQAAGGCQDYRHRHEYNSTCTPTKILDPNASVCAWDPRAHAGLTFDLEIRVPLSRAPAAIADVKKISELNPKVLCSFERSGIVMRTIKKASAYLGVAEDVVTFEVIYYRHQKPYTPKWNMDVFQEIEQMLVEKHGGAPHWGKSGGFLFAGAAQKALDLNSFLSVKRNFDPEGVFSNDWTDALLGIGGREAEELRDGCALEKLCKCREDRHCAPNKGYFCRAGRVWQNARVCRKE